MAMDFFGAQARAKRLTLWLVVLLIVAVLGMFAAAVAVVALARLLIGGAALAKALGDLASSIPSRRTRCGPWLGC
ncbi:hypothetical protein [Billgrantia antri]|uniref:Uncharacterized protein n=1 Tax=Billgrantia antri TaxID=2846777 RepID=A0ABS6ZHR6_9GAMM|nr:hypothetical protein [Halomonas antri]MBW6389604.1 hypothetical protein [Halomonas antri]